MNRDGSRSYRTEAHFALNTRSCHWEKPFTRLQKPPMARSTGRCVTVNRAPSLFPEPRGRLRPISRTTGLPRALAHCTVPGCWPNRSCPLRLATPSPVPWCQRWPPPCRPTPQPRRPGLSWALALPETTTSLHACFCTFTCGTHQYL